MSDRDKHFHQAIRLTDSSDYRNVFSNFASRSVDANFLMLARPNGLADARLGLAISKKNIKLATGRNKVKRLIRESFRINKNDIEGLDIVVLTRKKASYNDAHIINNSLSTHWKRLTK